MPKPDRRVSPWVRWPDPECLIRFTERDGRWVVTGLRIESESGVSASVLRSIPLGRVEQLYNAEAATLPPARVFEGSADAGPRGGPSKPGRVRVPPSRSYGDDFYAEVATKYRMLLAAGTAPSGAIAKDTGVPATTVNRWIRECRLRGYLPPARRGKR